MQSQLIEDALRAYFAQNKAYWGDILKFGIELISADPESGVIRFRLRFLSGEQYCCFETGCHCSLFRRKCWTRLRKLLTERGVHWPASGTVVLVGFVEVGAVQKPWDRKPGLVNKGQYEYEQPMREEDAVDR